MTKRCWTEKFVKVSIAVMLICTLCPTLAWASPSVSSSVVEQITEQKSAALNRFLHTGNSDDLFRTNVYNGDSLSLQSTQSSFPDTFDLREKGTVTPVKSQAPWGTCWSFGAIAAIETSLMTSLGLNMHQGDTPIDLSELHTAWFSYAPLTEGSQAGEGVHSVDEQGNDTLDPKVVLDQGGFASTAMSVYSSGIGPISESMAPYRNKEGIIEEGRRGSQYSKEGDWSVAEDLRFGQVFELEESLMLPTPSGRNHEGEYEYYPQATEIIKEEVSAGRGVEIAFAADTSRPEQVGDKGIYLNPETWAHYTYDTSAPVNHAVTIVGWDDTYSRTNFLADKPQPQGDGAWIVKNSWGALTDDTTSDLPQTGWGIDAGGYFYLSYYDVSITTPESFVFNVEKSEENSEYYLIDQYDMMLSPGTSYFIENTPLSMANVFTAEENQMVRSLSCETGFPNTQVTYQVYLLNADVSKPREPRLVAEEHAVYEHGGYHRIDLTSGVRVKKDEQYAVVITQKESDNYVAGLDSNLNKKGMEYLRSQGIDFSLYSVGVVNEGESILIGIDGNDWADLTDIIQSIQSGPLDPENPDSPPADIYDYDNFPIKAYADPIEIKQVIMPDLHNKTESEALSVLQELGLVGQTGVSVYSDNVEAGRVVSQSIAAGVEVEEGSTIAYGLSLGKEVVAPADKPTDDTPGTTEERILLATGDDTAGLMALIALIALSTCLVLALRRVSSGKRE